LTDPAIPAALYEETLRAVGGMADEDIDLADTALAIAALDREDADLTPYRMMLGDIAAAVSRKIPVSERHDLDHRAGALGDVLAGEYAFAGDADTYDDPRNADLIAVMDRRKGLPVALALLYLDVARRLGWNAIGINFPGHFLIRLEQGAGRVILDPFHGGMQRSAADLRGLLKQMAGIDAEMQPEHYAPIGNRATLIRLLNNIKVRAIADGDAVRGGEIIDRMLLIAPDETGLLLEAGACRARTGELRRAASALEAFLATGPGDAQRAEADALLRQVRQRLN